MWRQKLSIQTQNIIPAESTEEEDLGELIVTSIEGLGELAAGFEGEVVQGGALPSELDKGMKVAVKLEVIIV